MSWFLGRSKPKSDKAEGIGLPGIATGLHRSPGLALFVAELANRPPRAILDLGSSSTETVGFLSRFCDNISIQDLFQSARAQSGTRSTVFRFGDDITSALPTEGGKFDAVLIWDLLHYFDRSRIGAFVDLLAARCHDDALVYLMASAISPIPLTPIHFKIDREDMLFYQVASKERAESPQLRTRDVEQIMAAFRPLRLFQLRNGLQEFLFRFEDVSELEAGDAVAAQVSEVEEPSGLFG